MRLYLIRHAAAGDPDPNRWPDDSQRPLTRRGRRRFRRAARGLRHIAPAPDTVLSSRYVRAWQTAEILRRKAGWPAPEPCPALEGGLPQDILAVLASLAGSASVALTGHEPLMSRMVSYLTAGTGAGMYVQFRKGAVACLDLADTQSTGAAPEPGTATLLWLAQPKLLRALR